MSLTPDARVWIDRRAELTPNETDVLMFAWATLRREGREYNLSLANDDRAACAEAALIRYLIESRQP